ncbi:unnamed protein product, partial [Musa textilis]
SGYSSAGPCAIRLLRTSPEGVVPSSTGSRTLSPSWVSIARAFSVVSSRAQGILLCCPLCDPPSGDVTRRFRRQIRIVLRVQEESQGSILLSIVVGRFRCSDPTVMIFFSLKNLGACRSSS